jgi:hypothetical protein
MVNGFIAPNQVLTLSRDDLAGSGPVVAKITARAVEPAAGSFAGIIVKLDGSEPHDRTPADDPATNPLSSGNPDFDFYSIEVVQRIGYDSFCPDNGVLLAKNREKEKRNGGPNEFNCFNWVIDAHPEDINEIDFIKPDGTPVMRTIADYRQLNDALFHAGTNSGSLCEWQDPHNSLHFYIINVERNEAGILLYKIGVRSLNSVSFGKQSFEVTSPEIKKIDGLTGSASFTVKNTGEPYVSDQALHSQNTVRWLNSDIYRMEVSVEGKGWTAQLLNGLLSLEPGFSESVPVFLSHENNASKRAKVSLAVQSEIDPQKRIIKVFSVKRK